MAGSKRTVRASEISSFLYCRRAWWYQRQKVPAINTAELAGGEVFHRRHVSQTAGARVLKIIASVMVLAAIFLFIFLLAANF